MQKVYISGPITGIDPEVCRARFEAAKLRLRERGYTPVSPLENGLPVDAPYDDHMRRDLEMLAECDAIYMLNGWEHSKGCRIEFNVATTNRIPITFERED